MSTANMDNIRKIANALEIDFHTDGVTFDLDKRGGGGPGGTFSNNPVGIEAA
jgi:hypothetical protein